MSKKQQLWQHVTLAVLVTISFVLSFLLWTTGGHLAKDQETIRQEAELNEPTPSLVERDLTDTFRPVQYILHTLEDENFSSEIRGAKVRQKVVNYLNESKFERVVSVADTYSRDDYLRLLGDQDSFELIFADQMPIGMFSRRFRDLPKDTADREYDRLLLRADDPLLYFYDYKAEELTVISVSELDLDGLNVLLKEHLSEMVSVTGTPLKDDYMYLPLHKQKVPVLDYVATQMPNNVYINHFFQDTSAVDSRTTENITRYIDLTKEVSINQKDQTLTFLSQPSDSGDEMALTDRFQSGFDEMTTLDNWPESVIYDGYDPETKRLAFRRHLKALPVFSEDELTTVFEVGVASSSPVHLQMPLQYIQTPLTLSEDAERELMSGTTLLSRLREEGFVIFEQIEGLVIGYDWQPNPESEKVIHFEPEWFIKTNGTWKRARTVLENTEGAAYEF